MSFSMNFYFFSRALHLFLVRSVRMFTFNLAAYSLVYWFAVPCPIYLPC